MTGLTQVEHDARTLAAYAVSFAVGVTLEPHEFDHLATIAGRHGMCVTEDSSALWQRLQVQRLAAEAEVLARLSKTGAPRRWWQGLFR